MSFVGVVSKGTVVLPPDANLPDGTEAGRFSLKFQEFFLSRRVRETSFFLKVRKRREHGSPPGQG
jgi:hypothetical protein